MEATEQPQPDCVRLSFDRKGVAPRVPVPRFHIWLEVLCHDRDSVTLKIGGIGGPTSRLTFPAELDNNGGCDTDCRLT